jgi:O-antigen ligase
MRRLRRRRIPSFMNRRKSSRDFVAARERDSLKLRFIRVVTLATIFLLPLFFSPTGKDAFRLPEELLLRGGAIAITAAALVGLINGRWRFSRESLRRPPILFAVLALGWCVVSTLLSRNRSLSLTTLAYVAAVVVLAVATSWVVRRLDWWIAILIVLLPALVNMIALILQVLRIWNLHLPLHERPVGLLGNADYVGAYLVGAVVLALTAAIAVRRHRAVMAMMSGALALGVLLSQSVTALLALVSASIATFCLLNLRRALITTVALCVAVAIAGASYGPLRSRINRARESLEDRNYDALISGRLEAFLAAWQMAKDRPLTGVGPGCYHYEFLPYRLRVDEQYPELLRYASKGANFGEVHNDHLQLLAETGVVGYVLFLTAIGAVAWRSFRRPGKQEKVDEIRRHARLLALPLSVALLVVSAAQFPLELAPVLMTYVYLGNLVFAWSDHDQVA